jgi:hypothetical protein
MSDAASSGGDAKSEPAKSDVEPAANSGEKPSSDDKPVATGASEAATAEPKSAATDAADQTNKNTAEATASTSEAVTAAKAGETKLEVKVDDLKTAAPKADAVAPGSKETSKEASTRKPDDGVKAVTAVGAGVADVKKDQARAADHQTPAASKPDPAIGAAAKRSGQIAVFVSRKDAKLYVRQNFAPLFDVPVTIAPSDRPLGTHVFTAQVDKDDANVLHWSVVSLPAPSRSVDRRDEDERASRRHKMAGAAEMKVAPVPDGPAEALDRLTIPAEATARITEALSTGGSIIVSDQGINAGETGEGTDFIVSLR